MSVEWRCLWKTEQNWTNSSKKRKQQLQKTDPNCIINGSDLSCTGKWFVRIIFGWSKGTSLGTFGGAPKPWYLKKDSEGEELIVAKAALPPQTPPCWPRGRIWAYYLYVSKYYLVIVLSLKEQDGKYQRQAGILQNSYLFLFVYQKWIWYIRIYRIPGGCR